MTFLRRAKPIVFVRPEVPPRYLFVRVLSAPSAARHFGTALPHGTALGATPTGRGAVSKNNRENRARKKKVTAAKRKLGGSVAPSAFDDPEARRRLAIMYPFILLASAQPYTPDLQLTEGSIIIGKSGGTPGYVMGDDAFRIISELQGALGVSLQEILSVLVDAEATGLLELVNWQRFPAETRAQ